MPVESRAFARHPKVAEGSGFRRLARLAKRPLVTALANDERANAPAPVSKEWGQHAEWLLCDGFGGYACGTAIELPTRRYHSWLTVAAGDGRRRRLLAGIDEQVVVGAGSEPMTPAHWRSLAEPNWTETRRSFASEPVPTWILEVQSGARIERQLAMERAGLGHFDYLKDADGNELESSAAGHPMTYLHGIDSLLPGLERALVGKDSGDKFSATLLPGDAFGELKDDSEMRVPLSQLRGSKKWEPGMQAVIQTPQGHQQVTVLKVGHTMATVDTNHPMAGKTLIFDIEIVDVREASAEELSHGHAHGPGGHHH